MNLSNAKKSQPKVTLIKNNITLEDNVLKYLIKDSLEYPTVLKISEVPKTDTE